MGLVEVKSGDTFINREFPGIPSHLWVVLSDPRQNADRVLVVNVSSSKPGRDVDAACLLKPGDHPFISKESFAVYAKAYAPSVEKLREGLNHGLLRFHEPVSNQLLQRLRSGAMQSSDLPREYKELLTDQKLV